MIMIVMIIYIIIKAVSVKATNNLRLKYSSVPEYSVYQPYIRKCGNLPRISKWLLCLVAQHKYVFWFIYKTKSI
jgi:hypothetical protein